MNGPLFRRRCYNLVAKKILTTSCVTPLSKCKKITSLNVTKYRVINVFFPSIGNRNQEPSLPSTFPASFIVILMPEKWISDIRTKIMRCCFNFVCYERCAFVSPRCSTVALSDCILMKLAAVLIIIIIKTARFAEANCKVYDTLKLYLFNLVFTCLHMCSTVISLPPHSSHWR